LKGDGEAHVYMSGDELPGMSTPLGQTKPIPRHIHVETPRTNQHRPCAAHRNGKRHTRSWPARHTSSSSKTIRRSATARPPPPTSSTSRKTTSTLNGDNSASDRSSVAGIVGYRHATTVGSLGIWLNTAGDDEHADTGVRRPDVASATGLAQRSANSSRLRSAPVWLNEVASGCARIH
jgi:hypothetical protein